MGVTRRVLLVSMAGGAIAVAAGCGGSGSGSGTRGTAPTSSTRARVESMHGMIARGMSQGLASRYGGDTPNNGILFCDFGQATPEADYENAGGGVVSPRALPRTGDFLANVAMAPPTGRKARVGRGVRAGVTRHMPTGGTGVEPGHPEDVPFPTDWEPQPTFYFDYYLNLWVEVADESTRSLYRLYEDEDKTLPAGKIESVYPVNWESFPQEWSSSYEYTAGFLAGSHGFSRSVTNADYSGRMTYENVYADGWRDRGQSNWGRQGDSSWSSRYETADGNWSESNGTFRSDGSGGTRTKSSDGYEAVYTYNPDGSGRGRISGPDPGLPVTIIWDAYGNLTITYADGTTERFPGWGGYYAGGGDGSVPPIDGGTISEPDGTPPPAPLLPMPSL